VQHTRRVARVDQAVANCWACGDGVLGLVSPQLITGVRVDRKEIAVVFNIVRRRSSSDVDDAVRNRWGIELNAAGFFAGPFPSVGFRGKAPELIAGLGIQRVELAISGADEHHAIGHSRSAGDVLLLVDSIVSPELGSGFGIKREENIGTVDSGLILISIDAVGTGVDGAIDDRD
jgi:hypothetical protein